MTAVATGSPAAGGVFAAGIVAAATGAAGAGTGFGAAGASTFVSIFTWESALDDDSGRTGVIGPSASTSPALVRSAIITIPAMTRPIIHPSAARYRVRCRESASNAVNRLS
jgi:hypothetical protein